MSSELYSTTTATNTFITTTISGRQTMYCTYSPKQDNKLITCNSK